MTALVKQDEQGETKDELQGFNEKYFHVALRLQFLCGEKFEDKAFYDRPAMRSAQMARASLSVAR